jgi:hypothetical protein
MSVYSHRVEVSTIQPQVNGGFESSDLAAEIHRRIIASQLTSTVSSARVIRFNISRKTDHRFVSTTAGDSHLLSFKLSAGLHDITNRSRAGPKLCGSLSGTRAQNC